MLVRLIFGFLMVLGLLFSPTAMAEVQTYGGNGNGYYEHEFPTAPQDGPSVREAPAVEPQYLPEGDYDGDGIPNYMDEDSDNDLILDVDDPDPYDSAWD